MQQQQIEERPVVSAIDTRTIRDIVLNIERRVSVAELPKPEPKKPEGKKGFPRRLTILQRDVLDIIMEEIAKPFTLSELFDACNAVEPRFGTRTPASSESVRAYLCERAGLASRWSES